MKTRKIQNAVLATAAIILFASAGFTNAQSHGKGNGAQNHGTLFIDANGDGICDNFNSGSGIAPKDGTGNKYGQKNSMKMKNGNGTGVCDGTGIGSGKGKGAGVCDGTGPKGKGK